MTDAPELRRLAASDHEALIALWNDAGLSCKPDGRDARAAFERQLSIPQIAFFGLFEGERLIGSALATHDGRKGWINRVAVHPDRRRRGLGHELIRACEHWLSGCGVSVFACLIEGGNEASRATFRAAGYELYEGVSYFTKRSRPDA